MKKEIICFILCILFLLSLIGCKKCVDTQYSSVTVKVVDEYHRAAYITPIFNGKTTTIITHPAVYKITVEYNGKEYAISGSDTYNKYSNKIGESVTAILETKIYDDKTEKYNITKLE